MKYFFIVIMLLLLSCTKKIYVPVHSITTITETVRDTVVRVALQLYRDSVTTPDTISHLSNTYCESWARVSGGMLLHSLRSSGDSIPVKVQKMERLRVDSITVPYPVDRPVYIEKSLSGWQKARMQIGDISMGVLGILIIFWLIKKIK